MSYFVWANILWWILQMSRRRILKFEEQQVSPHEQETKVITRP